MLKIRKKYLSKIATLAVIDELENLVSPLEDRVKLPEVFYVNLEVDNNGDGSLHFYDSDKLLFTVESVSNSHFYILLALLRACHDR